MNVLIMCSSFSIYVVYYVEEMKKKYPHIRFSLFTHVSNKDRYDELLGDNVQKIFDYNRLWELHRRISEFPMFDVIHTFWMEIQWGAMASLLRHKTDKLIVSVGGSDLYRSKKWEHLFQKRLIAKADWISAENPETLSDFFDVYGSAYQIKKNKVVRFGLTNLEEIDDCIYDKQGIDYTKDLYNIPKDKLVITCGHNARKEHQHEKMINAIGLLTEEYRKKVHLMIPMTYPAGMEDYISQIAECAEKNGLTYSILTKFMDKRQMAQYEVCTDIMIHVQTTDQMCSTMLEQMYAGKTIIAGGWLPYCSVREAGVHFYSVETIDEITDIIRNCLDSMEEEKEKCLDNHDRIYDFSSWDSVSVEWMEMYNN